MSAARETGTAAGAPAMIPYVLSWIAAKADRRGVTALEYGIIASVLAIGLVAVFRTFGNNLGALFNRVGSSL